MNFYDMKVDIPYIVTKASDDESFSIGDRIVLWNDESLLNRDSPIGWLEPEDISETIIGMECKVDVNQLQQMIKEKTTVLNNLQMVLHKEINND